MEGGKAEAVLTTMPVLLEQAEPSWRYAFLRFWVALKQCMTEIYLHFMCAKITDYLETRAYDSEFTIVADC